MLYSRAKSFVSKPTTWIVFLLVINLLYLNSISSTIGKQNPEVEKALREVQKEAPELATGLYGAIERNGADNIECIEKEDIRGLESDIEKILKILKRLNGSW